MGGGYTTLRLSKSLIEKIKLLKETYGFKSVEEVIDFILDKTLNGKTINLFELVKEEFNKRYNIIAEKLEDLKGFIELLHKSIETKLAATELEKKEKELKLLREENIKLKEELKKLKEKPDIKLKEIKLLEFVCYKIPFRTYYVILSPSVFRIREPFPECHGCKNLTECKKSWKEVVLYAKV